MHFKMEGLTDRALCIHIDQRNWPKLTFFPKASVLVVLPPYYKSASDNIEYLKLSTFLPCFMHVEHVSISMSFNLVITSHAAHQTCRSHDQIWKVKSGHDSRTMQTVSSYYNTGTFLPWIISCWTCCELRSPCHLVWSSHTHQTWSRDRMTKSSVCRD